MAENIAKYGIKIDFSDLNKLKKKIKDIQKLQSKFKQSSNPLSYGKNPRQKNKEISDFDIVQKALTARLKKEQKRREDIYKVASNNVKKRDKDNASRFKTSVTNLTKPSGASEQGKYYRELSKGSNKNLDTLKKQQAKASRDNFKTSIDNLTKPSGASEQSSYYKNLSKESDAHYAKVNKHQDNQKKQRDDYWKAQRKSQEALGSAMNKDTNARIKADQTRIKALNKMKDSIKDLAWMSDKSATGAKKEAQERLKAKMDTAKTARELGRVLVAERESLRITKKKSFLMNRMNSSSKQMAGNLVSTFAVAAAGAYITRTGQDLESANNTLLSVTGSSEKAKDEMAFLRKESYRLGASLKDTAKDYSKLLAASGGQLSNKQGRELFTSVLETSTVLGLSAEDTTGSLRALSQMLSKGKITAEEYRQQLGDRMPVAMKAMTGAAVKSGVVTQELIAKYGSAQAAMEKLMSDGKLYTKDILPHFSAELKKFSKGGLAAALDSNRVAMNRLIFSVQNAADLIFKSGWAKGLTKVFNTLGDMLVENEALFVSLGKVAGGVFKALAWTVEYVFAPVMGALGSILHTVTDLLGETGVAVIVISGALFKAISIVRSAGIAFGILGTGISAATWQITALAAGLFVVLAALEEIAEFISPTGKKTLVGANIMDVAAVLPDALKPDSLKGKGDSKKGMALMENIGKMATFGPVQYASKTLATDVYKRIFVEGDVVLDSEKVGRISSNTEAAKSAMDARISGSMSNNF